MRQRSALALALLLAAAAMAVGAGSTEWYRWEARLPDGTGSPLLDSLRYRATLSLYRLCDSRDYPDGSGEADSSGCVMVGPLECPSLEVPFTADRTLPLGECSLYRASRAAALCAVLLLVLSTVTLSCGRAFASLALTFLGAAAAATSLATFYKWTPACSLDLDGAEVECTVLWSGYVAGGAAAAAAVCVLVGMHAACHPPAPRDDNGKYDSGGAVSGRNGAVGARKKRDIWFD